MQRARSATRAAAQGRRSSPALGSSAHRARASALCSWALVLDDLRALTQEAIFRPLREPDQLGEFGSNAVAGIKSSVRSAVAHRDTAMPNACVQHDVRDEPGQAESRV